MTAYVIMCTAALIYCGAYAVFCIRRGPLPSAVLSVIMTLLPSAVLVLSLI